MNGAQLAAYMEDLVKPVHMRMDVNMHRQSILTAQVNAWSFSTLSSILGCKVRT